MRLAAESALYANKSPDAEHKCVQQKARGGASAEKISEK